MYGKKGLDDVTFMPRDQPFQNKEKRKKGKKRVVI